MTIKFYMVIPLVLHLKNVSKCKKNILISLWLISNIINVNFDYLLLWRKKKGQQLGIMMPAKIKGMVLDLGLELPRHI